MDGKITSKQATVFAQKHCMSTAAKQNRDAERHVDGNQTSCHDGSIGRDKLIEGDLKRGDVLGLLYIGR